MRNRTPTISTVVPTIAIAVVSYKRPDVITQTLQILRKTYPTFPIYVADQNGHRQNHDLYESCSATVFWLDYDVGLSASRNWLFTNIAEDYILLIDDDDVPLPQSDEGLLASLACSISKEPDWLVVGGNRVGKEFFHFQLSRTQERWNELVGKLPAADPIGTPGLPCQLIEADTVHNFALFSRKRLVEWNLLWDEKLKILEHEDYYLMVKKFRERTGKGKVFYCDILRAREIPHRQTKDYRLDRIRPQLLNYVANKWNLDSFHYQASQQKWRRVWLNEKAWLREVLKLIADQVTDFNGRVIQSDRVNEVSSLDLSESHAQVNANITLWISERELRAFESRLAAVGFRFVHTEGYPPQNVRWELVAPGPPQTKWLFDPVHVKMDVLLYPSTKKAIPASEHIHHIQTPNFANPSMGPVASFRSRIYRTLVLTRQNGIGSGILTSLHRYLKSRRKALSAREISG